MDEFQQEPKNNSWLLIFLIIISCLLIITSCWLFWQNQLLKQQVAVLQTQSSSAPITKTDIPIPDWKIENNKFISNSFGFEITFPKNWKLEFTSADERKNFYILTALNEAKNYSVLIFVAPKNGNTLPGPTGFGAGEWKEIGSINLLGQKLVKKALIYDNNAENIMYSSLNDRIITYPNSNTLFNFIIYPTESAQNKIPIESVKEFDQILSTFKFTE